MLTFTLVFHESSLRQIVRMIAEQSNELIETANLNVENEQYVCAGTVSHVLYLTLNCALMFRRECR